MDSVSAEHPENPENPGSPESPRTANLRVEGDRTRCCGAGMCTLNVPEVFDQDDAEGLVVVLDPEPPRELHEAVRVAVSLCPASAIGFFES